ncbi:MAG: TonB-dependent receptor [Prevotella sp.]|nr:TonB-dependent receptor [Prevotella sp.]
MTVKLFRIVFTALFTCIVTSLSAQTITGNVKDSSGEPILGATIMETGTKNGTVTDIDGNFTIKLQSAGNLNVSYIGMKPQVVKTAGKTAINVILQDDNTTLNEIVVVGYGTMKKSDLTGSVSSVGTEKLNEKGAPGLMESLQGATPGVNITTNTGRAGGGYDIEIRGKSSINSNTTPLFVVDGVMCDDIDWLNPQDIDRIDVLKDASSTAIYGSRATAGVVMVTTKGSLNIKKQEKATISYDGYYGWTKTTRMPDFMDGQSFYNYRFMKFLGYGSTEGAMLNMARPTYKMDLETMQQGLLWNGEKYVMKEMLASGNTYDWPSLVTNDGSQQNHYLAVSGSTEKVNYHAGVGYNQINGIYEADKQRRINFKGSLDAKVNKLVSIGFNFNMARQENEYANDDAVQDAYRMNPYMVPYYLQDQYDKDGAWHLAGEMANFPGNANTLGTTATGMQFTDAFNPMMQFKNSTKQRETWRILGNVYLKFDFTKELSFKTTFSPNYTYYREGYYKGYEDPSNPGHTFDVTASSPYIQQPIDDAYTWSEAYYDTNRSLQWTWDNIINYNKTFGKHSVGAMGLISMESKTLERAYWAGTNTKMIGSDWYAMANLQYDNTKSYTEYKESSLMSYALRVNYGFMDKYLLTATVRWDGSSKFAEGNKWGSFPSVAAAWRISEENFMKKLDWVSNLKLRVAYGVTGNNTGIGEYATMSTPTRYGVYPGMPTGFVTSGVVDRDLKWETSKEFNVGIDFGFLRNRISGSIDWYTKTSDDLLQEVYLPLEAGLDKNDNPIRLTTNIGSVRNTGVEVSLTGVAIDTKDWNWTVSANFAMNKNKILEINGVSDRLIDSGNTKSMVEKTIFIGQSYNVLWGYKYDGVVSDRMMTVPDNQAAIKNGFTPGEQVAEYDYYYKVYGIGEGLPKIADTDGNGTINEDDRQFFRGDPKFTGTFTSNLSYKNWDFGFSIYAKLGQHVYSSFMEEYTRFSDRGRQHLNADFYIPAGALVDCDGMNPDGTYINPVYQETTHYGEYPFPNNAAAASGLGLLGTQFDEARCIQKASFAKVKNITLGYTFPKKWLKPWHCSFLRLYFTVTNPFVFTNYKGFDPEWASAARKSDGPSTVTYQVGASIKF